MEETYCGKSCAHCMLREELACPGCKEGPGRPVSGECNIASCCRSTHHANCETCMDHTHCAMLDGRIHLPEQRLNLRKVNATRQEELQALLPRWILLIRIVFWLRISIEAASLLKELSQQDWIVFCGLALSAVLGAVFLWMRRYEPSYLWAGLLCLVATAAQLFLNWFPDNTTLMLLGAAASLGRIWQELAAHSALIGRVSTEMELRFQNLWKWTLWSYGAILASIILMLLLPILGLITVVVSLLASATIAVLIIIALGQSIRVLIDAQQP